jgi:hypothetical protein
VGLFVLLLLFSEVGRRMGIPRISREPEGVRVSLSTVEGAVLALLGLLTAFPFSGAASRFDHRRHPSSEEAKAISTAYLSLDLLKGPDRERLQYRLQTLCGVSPGMASRDSLCSGVLAGV